MILIPNPQHADIIDQKDSMYPTEMFSIQHDFVIDDAMGNMYGYCTKGSFAIHGEETWIVKEGNFFSIKTDLEGETPIEVLQEGQLFVILRYGFRGIDMVGQSEKNGRLSYIDGCTDSLLVMPPRLGDPCLNYLHFPMGIDQTQHLHPSIRMGIVIGGKGEAFQKPEGKREGWEEDLTKGMMFCLEEGEVHSFRTAESYMDIIAYHPDSDFGPTDTNHPMLNRTYINHGKG